MRWPLEQVWKGCRQTEDSLAIGQVIRYYGASLHVPTPSEWEVLKDEMSIENQLSTMNASKMG